MPEDYSSGYRIELLKANNWMPWKQRMLAILRDLGLEKYIEADSKPSGSDEAKEAWRAGDAKTRTRIELAVGDSEMIHISGAETAAQMWKQLSQVKESKGKLGVLATRRNLFRAMADEGFDMVEHVSNLRRLQAELHTMGSKVSDEDFFMILITSLPESWDNYTSAYLGANSNSPTITSHELISILMEEDRRRKGREGDGGVGTTLQSRKVRSGGNSREKECFNCRKKGHVKAECWSKGGGREGEGPKGRRGPHRGNRTHQANEINSTLNDVAYMSNCVETSFNTYEISKYDWLLDSCTTSHICTSREAFSDYRELHNGTVQGIGPNPARALGRGTVAVHFTINGQTLRHHLRDVLHVPDAPNCLLSVPRLDEAGGTVVFENGTCILKDKDGRAIGVGHKSSRLYKLEARLPYRERANIAAANKATWDQWHRRYGHLSVTALEKLQKEGLVEGLGIDESSIPSVSCEACIQAKQTRKKFPKEAEHRSETPGERFMSDVWGPAQKTSVDRHRYYISFTDDCTRYVTVLFLKDKSEAFDRISGHIAMLKNQGRLPKYMRFDNGKELINQKLKELARENGIVIEPTAPYSPSQNGVAERFNRTLMELARAMLIGKDLPVFLWDHAVAHAAYLRNRAPTRALQGQTPYEAWMGRKPNVAHLREFGSDVWVLDQSNNKSKLAPRSKKMVLVGYNDGSKSIRYYDPNTRSVKVSRNFVFNENDEFTEPEVMDVPGIRSEGEHTPVLDAPASKPAQINPRATTARTPAHLAPKEAPGNESDDAAEVEAELTSRLRTRTKQVDYKKSGNPQARTPAPRFAQSILGSFNEVSDSSSAPKTRKASKSNTNSGSDAPDAIGDFVANIVTERAFLTDGNAVDTPQTREEALVGPEAGSWRKAMDEEMNTLKEMGTWELGELPSDRKAIGCRWVFAKKRNEKGEVVKYKARLVAQGFSQKPGKDYAHDGTFAPVMRFDTLRTALAHAATHNWKLRQFDVKGAYLHGRLKENIYMRQAPGYGDESGRVCVLKRSLYGLKQAGNVWNGELNKSLGELGFQQLKSDYCCYIRREDEDQTILLVWVDDFIALSTSDALNDRLDEELNRYSNTKSLGTPKMILNIRIEQGDHLVRLSQTHYIDALLERFRLEDATPVSTPMEPQVKLDESVSNSAETKQGERNGQITFSYLTLLGSLMYLATGTRPDIAFAVYKLAQYAANPKPLHWTAVKRIFRYLKGTRTWALTYGGSDELLDGGLNIFCDADWAANYDRKSISGYVVTMAGGAIAWSSKKQATVALSTTEAEYISATHVAKQVIWLRSLLTELGLPLPKTSTIFSDNQSSISIAHHPEFHARTKHIDIAYHFLRDLVDSGVLNLVYIRTEENLADLFTKGLPRQVHQDLTFEIGVIDEQGGVL
ncbi:hypothetical protein NMY22_g3260 [Coprinellus aureogranulatus]|nr:hypothetical protein NMY22_g3260 [Coprinellus aureogranulatus]